MIWMSFTIEIAGDRERFTLRLGGRLDSEGGEILLRAVEAARVSVRSLTLDLRALQDFTAAGAGALSRCGRTQPNLRFITGAGVGKDALLAALGSASHPGALDEASSSV